MIATREQIVHRFLGILRDSKGVWRGWNWGCHPRTDDNRDFWKITEHSYINGVMLEFDMDYHMAYLLEIVDALPGQPSPVSYVVVVTFHGFHHQNGTIDHDSEMFSRDCGTFFDRKVTKQEVEHWAVDTVQALCEWHQDRTRRREP
jgi:hypothetical protein